MSNNRIWAQRLIDVGTITSKDALDLGFSGIMLRGSGLLWDLRLIESYDNYNLFKFDVPIGIFGDSYDRYLIRLEEMRESLNIMTQALKYLKYFNDKDSYFYCIQDNKLVPPSRGLMKNFMESLISHFKIYSEGISIPREEVYSVVEAPKGDLVFIWFQIIQIYLTDVE